VDDDACSLPDIKYAMTKHGLNARQLVRDYVNSYTLIDNLAVCQDKASGEWRIYDIDLSDDELAVAQAEHQRQLQESNAPPEANSAERAKLLHAFESCTRVRCVVPTS
jgi:hypothetical protein